MISFVFIGPDNGKLMPLGHVLEIWQFTENTFVCSMDYENIDRFEHFLFIYAVI